MILNKSPDYLISTTTTTAVVATESTVEARRGQRTIRRRLQRLQEDYYKLLGNKIIAFV